MQNLNPIRIVARRGRDLMLIGAAALMIGLVVGAIGLFISIVLSSSFLGIIFLIVSAGLVLTGIVLVIRGLTLRRDNEEARTVGEALSRELDQRYTYIRNIGRRGLGYIDALLIGPPGALVFRITNEAGSFLNEQADWLEQTGGRSFRLRHNFTRECVVDIHALRDYLAKRALHVVPVYGVIVFVNPHTQISTRNPVVPSAQLSTLKTVLQRDYLATDRISPEVVQKAIDAVYK
jgi:hypothetical protein